MIRDAAVYIRQFARDYGYSVAAARQVAKMLVRAAAGAKRGKRVQGVRRWPPVDRSMGVPFGFVTRDMPPPDFRLAAVCHLFYPELADEFRETFAHVPGRMDVIASTDTEDKRVEIARAFDGWDKGTVTIRIVANRGRDIAPKLTVFNEILDRYDLLLVVHSKRTIRPKDGGGLWDEGEEWRRHLLHNLAGSTEIAISILEAFRRDPRLGLIMPQHWERVRDVVDWHEVFFRARDLARRIGLRLTPAHVIDFPSGSMFWARPGALQPMLGLGLRTEDFQEETGQLDGTLAHTLERMFLFTCEAAGYRWAKVCDAAWTEYPRTVIPIATPAALDDYRRRHGFRLTASSPA